MSAARVHSLQFLKSFASFPFPPHLSVSSNFPPQNSRKKPLSLSSPLFYNVPGKRVGLDASYMRVLNDK